MSAQSPSHQTDDWSRITATLDPDSFECPDCQVIVVPSDDRSPRPEDVHRCP